jgi:hypothetical protein
MVARSLDVVCPFLTYDYGYSVIKTLIIEGTCMPPWTHWMQYYLGIAPPLAPFFWPLSVGSAINVQKTHASRMNPVVPFSYLGNIGSNGSVPT